MAKKDIDKGFALGSSLQMPIFNFDEKYSY